MVMLGVWGKYHCDFIVVIDLRYMLELILDYLILDKLYFLSILLDSTCIFS